jgi:pilus assembly protein CpaB
MKVARIAVAGVAVVAGLGAALLVGSGGGEPPRPEAPAPIAQVEVRGPPTTEVLVAVSAVPVGGTLTPQSLDWRRWPDEALAQNFIRRTDRPNAREELQGAISRFPLYAGEPINEARIIKADRPGFMAAILPPGTRAIALPITPETGAAGFILPNDRVDVILTRRERAGGQDTFVTDTILSNVRVLAIDQTVQERDGEKVVVGRTATLQLQPRQAETIALARQLGEMSLALRSLADGADAQREGEVQRSSTVTIIRYGTPVSVPVLGR